MDQDDQIDDRKDLTQIASDERENCCRKYFRCANYCLVPRRSNFRLEFSANPVCPY